MARNNSNFDPSCKYFFIIFWCFDAFLQIAKTLDTKYGKMLKNAAPKSQKLMGFTDKNIQKHLKEMARNQYNHKLSTSKVTKFISAASYLWTLTGMGRRSNNSNDDYRNRNSTRELLRYEDHNGDGNDKEQ